MSIIELTEEQRQTVLSDMNDKTEMLTDAEIEHLATRLNEKVNIPFLRESSEQTVLVKLVKKVDRYLYNALPNELYGLVQDATDGVSDEEAKELREILATRANKQINIKYLPEIVEQEIFEFLIGFIINAMRKNVSILNSA